MEGFFQFEKNQIHYTMKGTGTNLVLLHGYLESLEVWNDFSGRLSEVFTVICIDLPGHGLSGVYDEKHTMEFMAGVVNELLVSLGIEKVFMVGHSLGGYVTLAFLDLFPSMLNGYCLFHSHPFADQPATIEKRKTEIGYVRDGKKDLVYPVNVEKMFATSNLPKFHGELRRLQEIASKTPDEGIIAVLNGMIERPSRADLMEEGLVSCLWILGRHDNYIPCEEIQKRVKLPSNAEVLVLKNSGHLGFIEEEGKALEKLKMFVVQG
jgi:pimeloyl-ACP methyl ester carboxylesterase